ncbi:hypothetical protein GTY78_23775 [Streptomyces sp. SID4934]|uniref:Secreted protein n=1 Tax=Streptomyces wadayamensis TaxID=141454 RepID=A0ABR4S5S3_9ACTN|nr:MULTISPECIES: hypothetical protein [Streptomyces]MYQ74022.1 hypothetical protein [Streptomyces sp. SID4934]KDR60987.1 hypothetical protein DC60_02950 [Streptomyces wadayamensis]QXQ25846.1 hypothetical protein STALF2_14520 [Streptomyces albidoflavus]QXQ31776.1 hypothetical protein STALF4_14570 [Streptomyces albidoflavus]SCE35075.1 hypothetical protein GA0115237_1119140 [Streptomyces sp. ScaeMP-6W]
MSITSQLVFLGPALGAVVTSLYTVYTVRQNNRVEVHTSYIERRLDILTGFLEAVERCQDVIPPAERQKALRAVDDSMRRVRLTFPDRSGVTESAQRAAKCAIALAIRPCPDPLEEDRVLAELMARQAEAEAQEAWSVASDFENTRDFLREVKKEQKEAAGKGGDDPADRYLDELWHREETLKMSLSGALPSMRERERFQREHKAHEKAVAEYVVALDEFPRCTARWMGEPLKQMMSPRGPRRVTAWWRGRKAAATGLPRPRGKVVGKVQIGR